MHANNDGAESCTLNGKTWSYPITVWRGITTQAEDAEGGAFVTSGGTPCNSGTSGCAWAKGGAGFNVSGCTPGASGCAIVADSKNGMGKRVGYIGPGKGVKFTGVNVAAAGTNNLVVFTTNGDAPGTSYRHLNFVVNGGAPQNVIFPGNNSWSIPVATTVTLGGFIAGSNNTIYVVGDAINAAPDLDWIEIVNSSTGTTQALTGTCDESRWTESASVNASTAGAGNDSNLGTRFTTGRAMSVNDSYTVDFQGTVKLSQLVLDSTQTSANDFPGKLAVLGSTDGTSFGLTLAANVSGAANKTTITFPVTVVRAVRIVVTAANTNGNYWSIGELTGACSLQSLPLPGRLVGLHAAVVLGVLEARGRRLVAHDDGARVELQRRRRDHRRERPLDHGGDGGRLARAVRDQHAAPRLEDRRDAHRDDVARDGLGAERGLVGGA
jgi:hypothetical protein